MKFKLFEKIRKKIQLRKIRRLPIYERGRARFLLEYNGKYKFGFASYGLPEIDDWHDGSTLQIGAFCSIARDVRILLGGNHRSDWISTYPFPVMFPGLKHIKDFSVTRGDVLIGSDVWICTGVKILSGVTIGHGAIIAAGSVVSRDIPPYAIYAGNPAKFVRFRFSSEIINSLLYSEWWDWPREELLQLCDLICSSNVESFVEYIVARKS
jgi:acetyltransferase-like isoleucine patch superfamily enzyme